MESAFPASAALRAPPRPRPRAIANLLFLVAALVFAMVVVGGITRLTESGLSITEWKPITGAVPPPRHAQSQRACVLSAHTSQYARGPSWARVTLGVFAWRRFGECARALPSRGMGLALFVGVVW